MLLPKKEDFYCSLNKENITNIDSRLAKIVNLINFNNKNIDNYYDFYVQRDTLLLADVFENSTNKCIEIYELDPDIFCLYLD